MIFARGANAQGAIDVFEFSDAAEELRYQSLIAEFRCPKCLNTNLAGSDAPIASDLRREVHRLVTSGATDQDIRDYLQTRYGDFVLYDPPLRPGTLLLWGFPVVLAAIAGLVVFGVARRAKPAGDVLTPQDRARLDTLVGADGAGTPSRRPTA